jgi:hypothetical protein
MAFPKELIYSAISTSKNWLHEPKKRIINPQAWSEQCTAGYFLKLAMKTEQTVKNVTSKI